MSSASSLREPHDLLPPRTDTDRQPVCRALHQTYVRAHLGRTLPGPLPAGEREPDPGAGVTEHHR